jgi:outer membrane protein OmpA-like peptidoglycan-associated protein
MKKITKLVLIMFLGLSALNMNSQNKSLSESDYMNRWVVRLGFNTVDSNGNENTSIINNLIKLDEEAYHGIPLKLGVEYRISKIIGVELSGSMNKWKAGEGVIDGMTLTEDQKYYSADGAVKIYYDNLFNIFKTADWLELNVNAGLGFFKLNKVGVTGNLGTGANFWVSDHLGINIDAVAKWNIDRRPSIYDTNHVQYSVGLSYRFKDQDQDNDGIYDYDDECPEIPGLRELYGCPEKAAPTKVVAAKILDTDGDTVIDSKDKCPKVAGLVSRQGCPDSDDDGILDKDDKCPKMAGLKSNFGCPRVAETRTEPQPIRYDSSEIERLSKLINFNTSKSSFTQETYSNLQNIISFINRYPASRFRISGHTDSVGSESSNRALSQRRADAVKAYLLSNGVSSYNLEQAIGYGESQPIQSNDTKEGRRMNRRVEINQID